ncbi:AAA domain protein [Burkholderia pseudomallei MSHR2543]|uniref:AAA family ATPase n=1 Tax=Burkholderia pseudomallei TaxID=28450 RepID=UPI0005D8223A|nr:AAA family ATPase [Burkholderia pseudomallei]AJX79140.1 AAA domain protein [Burkholderia pseudomallei MSHR2543]
MESAQSVVRRIVITGSGGCLRDGVWDNVPLLAIVTGENGTGKSQLLHALGRRLGAQVDQPQGRHLAHQSAPYGNAGVSLQGVTLSNGSVFYSPSAWTMRSAASASEGTLTQRVNELYGRPSQTITVQPNPEWRDDPAYADFVVEETASSKRIVSQPSLEAFRDRLTPLHIAAPAFYPPTQFDLALYFFAYELLSANLRSKGVSDAEIEKRFGEKPWDLLNEILAAASLSLRVLPPTRITPSVFSNSNHYQLHFIDEQRGATFSFEGLSSGEKVIVSTILWRLAAESTGNFFQLLLLDEPDAHLHPSMVKRFLTVIENVFVKARGVGVIMTTHSPTTVALAPADSIFILERRAGGIPRKAEKDEALRHLTTGVPALSIAHEHRRQVFVESKGDAEFYEQIYLAHKEKFISEISLEFIPVGQKKDGGCERVRYIVEHLAKAGNPWVYGLVDRDAGQSDTERVKIAGFKRSIENYLYDPIFLAVHLRRLNLWQDPKFHELYARPPWEIFDMEKESLQQLCTYISETLLGTLFQMHDQLTENTSAKAERENVDRIVSWARESFNIDANRFVWSGPDVVVGYAGGAEISQPRWLSDMRGHDLEYVAHETFKELKSHKNRPSGNARQGHLVDLPSLAPIDVLDTLLSIQSHVLHIEVKR